MGKFLAFVDYCHWYCRHCLDYQGAAAEPDLDRQSCADTYVKPGYPLVDLLSVCSLITWMVEN